MIDKLLARACGVALLIGFAGLALRQVSPEQNVSKTWMCIAMLAAAGLIFALLEARCD